MRANVIIGATLGLLLMTQIGVVRGEYATVSVSERIARLIMQLGDDAFAIREAASRELATIGEPAIAALQKATAATNDLEIRQRAKQIVTTIHAEIAAQRVAKEMATWQGSWQVYPDGTKVVIADDSWSWIDANGAISAAGRLKVVELGDDKSRVEWAHEVGPMKGASTKVIMHISGVETLDYNGSYDDFPTDLGKGPHARAMKKLPK
jgi:hypothetical protein